VVFVEAPSVLLNLTNLVPNPPLYLEIELFIVEVMVQVMAWQNRGLGFTELFALYEDVQVELFMWKANKVVGVRDAPGS
jgi:hypothetical protein